MGSYVRGCPRPGTPAILAVATTGAMSMSFERAGVCTLDCPDTCSLTVTVDADRVVKVRGSDALPYTEGVICNKVAHHSGEFVHGSRRLRAPLQRIGPRGSERFERISWEHSLETIHQRVTGVIVRWGRGGVMPLNYAGPPGMLAYDSMSLRFFHKLGASLLFRGSMCGAVRNEAWVGTHGGVPGIGPEAAAQAKLNVVWGNNATVTNVHLVRNIHASKRRGGRLVVVDPLRTKIAEQADLHLTPRPSTDVLLGFALAVELERLAAHTATFIAKHVSGYDEFMRLARDWPPEKAAEGCGVAASDICTFARWLGEADPLGIAQGDGLERSRNGGSGVRAAVALPALLGKLSATSGVVLCARFAFPKTPDKLTRTDLIPASTRTLNILDIGRHIERDDIDPPLRAIFIYNHNPIVVHPDQNRMRKGLLREDIFLVGVDVAMTESMQLCDVVLPAATHFEYDDLYPSYGHHSLQGVKPSEMSTTAALRMTPPDNRPLALFDNLMPATPSGKIELASDALAQRWGPHARLPRFRPRASEFPLALVSPAP